MFKLYMGYYYEESKKTKVIKIGQTTQTCWQRCKKEDYHICQACELMYYPNIDVPKGLSDFLEAAIIFEYRNKYPTYKGNEYFDLSDKSEYQIEKEWRDIVESIIKKYATTIDSQAWFWRHGFVGPYTY